MEKNYQNTKSRRTNNTKYNEPVNCLYPSSSYYTESNCQYYKASNRYKSVQNGSSSYATYTTRYRKKHYMANKYARPRPSHDFAQLPNIVLAKVYSYLNLKDRLNASLACKNWRIGLFNPSLWQNYKLTIYLLNRFMDLKSSEFKMQNLSKYTKNLTLKYDPNDLNLITHLTNAILKNLGEFKHLTSISLQPILYNLFYEDGYFYDEDEELGAGGGGLDEEDDGYLQENNANIFNYVSEWCTKSKQVEHLSLGLMDDMSKYKVNLAKLLSRLCERHCNYLKSLHVSTSKKISSLALQTTNANIQANVCDEKKFTMSPYLIRFVHLTQLSVDYEHLSDDFLRSGVCLTSLKKLNLNVNSINNTINFENRIKDESWSLVTNSNKDLRVTVNFMQVEESVRKYTYVLNPFMPLETLRMYFCKSLNPDILQFISNNYSETLKGLVIVDVITDPALRYHNPLRHDADPDPLVLLCWKCKYLSELVLVGYEILEINLIAIAKLRDNLKTFYVAMDCIIDLKYGKFKNDDFIEDEDGEDTIVDYGFCSEQVIRKVCKILRCDNWHPLEKDELPMCVYNYDMPYEEAYLEKVLSDLSYN